MSHEPIAVLRIRPDSMPRVGLSKNRLLKIAALLAERDESAFEFDDVATTVLFATVSTAVSDTTEIADSLRRALRSAAYVVVDLDFPTSRLRQGAVDALLATGFAAGLQGVTEAHHVLLLLHERLPTTDRLGEILANHQFAHRIVTITTPDAHASAADWTPTDRLRAAVRVTREDLVDDLGHRTIRRRGVFSPVGRPSEFAAFRYTPEQCLPTLTALLTLDLEEHPTDVVVYDSESPWLAEVVLTVCTSSPGTMAVSFDDLFADADEPLDTQLTEVRRRLAIALDDPNTRPLLVVPLTKSGRSLVRAIERTRKVFTGPLRLLSVMMDVKRIGDDGTAVVVADDHRFTVEYFLRVRQHMYTENDWQVRAAIASDSLEDPSLDWAVPSPIGLWSLYEELGCDVETPVPERRLAIRWFPQLHSLTPEDALWLAESMVRVAERELDASSRSNLLFILPDERSGAHRIAEALRQWLDVPVLRVPRRVIDGAESVPPAVGDRIAQYADHHLVIADESTVTYQTLQRLASLATERANRPPDLTVVALELPATNSARPLGLRALHRWRPSVLVTTSEMP